MKTDQTGQMHKSFCWFCCAPAHTSHGEVTVPHSLCQCQAIFTLGMNRYNRGETSVTFLFCLYIKSLQLIQTSVKLVKTIYMYIENGK